MDDPLFTPDPNSPKESVDPGAGNEPIPPGEVRAELIAPNVPRDVAHGESIVRGYAPVAAVGDADARRRSFRHNLFLLLSLTLAAFILTSWILVRVDAPFGIFSTGPQEIVRAQLRALDRGELRPAYNMFSPRYRTQVSFDTWHELFVTHWRMFHADVVRAETPAYDGPGVTLEIYLHGADGQDYRARFTLIRTEGRWWIDDVHWTEEGDERDFSRT
ncbi:MAG TPA: DUF4864 domain-containing protein [Candidatus Acidoferrales bacterium]|jgi:hypothetical protein|nr:DUF4864 domain-containing protein [Candidatus Acidoferrales bacterium]